MLDSVETETVSYNMYISENGTRNKSDKVTVKADFSNFYGGEVSFDFDNFVANASVWEVLEERSGKATFDFAGDAYFDVTMYNGEKVLLDLNRDYVRNIAIAYEDADLEFYNFRGTHDEFVRKGTLSLYAEEGSYVYEIRNGALREIDFKYNDDEETIEIVTDTLGHYVVSDMELDTSVIIPTEDEEEDEITASGSGSNSNNSDKNNPDTGAHDFVGSAAALAVVSVAAAGALALKRK